LVGGAPFWGQLQGASTERARRAEEGKVGRRVVGVGAVASGRAGKEERLEMNARAREASRHEAGPHLHHEQLLAERAAALAQHLVRRHGDDRGQGEDEGVDVPAGRVDAGQGTRQGMMDGLVGDTAVGQWRGRGGGVLPLAISHPAD
jgi:hypothetical protein